MFDKVFSITLSLWNAQLFVPDIKSEYSLQLCACIIFQALCIRSLVEVDLVIEKRRTVIFHNSIT